MTELEILKQQVAEMQAIITRAEQEAKFTYPMWFKSTITGGIVKFLSLNEGEVIANGISSNTVGEIIYNLTPHIDSAIWTQVDEPKPKPKQWEPQGGEYLILTDGNVYKNKSVPYSRLFGSEYQTKEQAEWASKQMRSFNHLLCYIAEHTNGILEDIIIASDIIPRLEIYVPLAKEERKNLYSKIQSGEVIL